MYKESQNFLLKTLEEPSKNTYIFLTSSKPYLLQPTLLSRLNHVSIHSPAKKEILNWLKSINIKVDAQELNFLEDKVSQNKNFMLLCGFEKFDNLFVRIDILERLFVQIINATSKENNEIKLLIERLSSEPSTKEIYDLQIYAHKYFKFNEGAKHRCSVDV